MLPNRTLDRVSGAEGDWPSAAPSPEELLDCAVSAVRAAGAHALNNLARRTEVMSASDHDVKLQLDLECQEKAVETILSHFPDHNILGEEDEPGCQVSGVRCQKEHPASSYEWIVDPIDGTVNFFHGVPFWCSSVAVRRDGQVLAGAVFAPELDELYTATADGPAECNGSRISVSRTATLPEAMVLTGMDRTAVTGLPSFSLFEKIADNAQKARIMGSAAVDICLVARGRADAYFEAGIYIWDIAAAGLIVERAGGKTEHLRDADTNQRLTWLATNGLVHEELKELLGLGPDI